MRPDINMSPARQRKELTEFQNSGIVALSHDKNPPEISNDLHIPRQTVFSFLKRFNQRQSTENLPCLGRPREISITANRCLIGTALDKIKLQLKELHDICNLPFSQRKIQRQLPET